MGSPRVLFVTPEFDDFVRVGGLGSVSAALPRALSRLCDIRVIIPGCRQVLAHCSDMQIVGCCSPLAGLPACSLGRIRTPDGLAVYVVVCPALYEREGSPYGDVRGQDWHDNDIRFARFSAAAADLAAGLLDPDWAADLVHINDWPSALVPAYLTWNGHQIPTLLTIHNLAYQGLFTRETLGRIGAPQNAYSIEGIEFYNKVSFLKAGIFYASHLTTVSQTYAREITTHEYGCGLDGLLSLRATQSRLTGILNGIDESWDPRTCSDLVSPFEAGDWKGKRVNADYVRKQFGLALSRGPLFGLVARLVHQKGVDLVLSAAETIVAAGGQIVVTGTGEEHLERALKGISRRFPDSIGVTIGFDDGEARRIFAGSDFIFMPSRFEPCGLSQMYAQRFGSPPIGHNTGGLSETIEDGKTGFLFRGASVEGFLGGVCRAFSTFGSRPKLNTMRRNAMARAFGWNVPASSYAQLYGHICAFRRSRPPIPTDRDHLFRSIATSAALVLTAPSDDGGDVSVLAVGQARGEAVPVVNRRDPRATRRALTADAAARAGGPC
jgi:starch synthase